MFGAVTDCINRSGRRYVSSVSRVNIRRCVSESWGRVNIRTLFWVHKAKVKDYLVSERLVVV